MEKKNIKEYLQEMLDRWNKYDELDGFVADNFRVDLEKTLEYWDLRIADNKEELEKSREEGRRDGALAFYIELEDWLYEKGYAKDGEIKVPTEVFMRFVAKELKLNSKKK